MIKVILFDVGGCYLEGSFISFVNKSRKVLDIDKELFSKKEVVFDKRLNKGEISAEECFRKYFGVPIDEKQMKKIVKFWTSTWKLSNEMKKLILRLKDNYRLAILSNSDSLNSENYTKKGWYKYFDTLIISHEIGIIKPQKEIYQIAIEKLKIRPNECLFIDDQEDCLKPAREIGMKTILFKSISQLEKELYKS